MIPFKAWFAEAKWRAAGFLALAAALNYADRAAISAVYPALRTDFGLSDAQIGLLGSVFLWAYALGSPLAGALSDRHPRRVMVILSLALWSLVTGLLGAAPGLVALVVLRGALGLAESLYLPAATALLAEHHTSDTRGRAMSVHSVGLNFGVVIGGAFAGYLAEWAGWRAGFWVLGAIGVVLAVGSRWLLPATPAQPSASGGAHHVEGTQASKAKAGLGATLRYLVHVPSFHVLLAKAMLAGVGIWVFLNWLPLYLKEAFGLSMGFAGLAGMFLLQGSTVLGIACGGWISDWAARRDPRHRMLAQGLSYFAAAVFLLPFLAHPGFALVSVSVAAFSFFRGLGQANENPTLCEIVPERYRSTAIGFMNTCATAAGGLGVMLAGFLKAALGLNAIFAGLALLFTIAGAALVYAHRHWMARDLARAREPLP